MRHILPIPSARSMILASICIILAILVYSIIFNVDLFITIVSLNPIYLSLSIFFALVSFILESLRLKFMTEMLNTKLNILAAIKARALGALVAYITPSSMGGEPARAFIISIHSDVGFWQALGITLVEAYADAITVCTVALILSISYLPYSIVVILMCIYTIAIVNGLLFLVLKTKTFSGFIEKLKDRYFKSIEKRFKINMNFVNIINGMRGLFNRKFSIIIALTFIRHLIAILAIYYASLAVTNVNLIRCIEAYFFSSALGIVPTPGAVGALEYGLSITLLPKQVVVIRLINYVLIMALGIMSIVLVLRQLSIRIGSK